MDRYLLRELWVPFLIGTLTVVMMFQANTYIALAKNLNLANVPVSAVLQFIWYETPSYLIMTLPVGTALGTSLAMTRLVRETEVTAMRSAGAPILRILLPLTLFGLATALVNFYIVEYVTPKASARANSLSWQIGMAGFAPNVKTNTLIQLGRYMASFGTVSRQGDDMDVQKILLIEQPAADSTTLITADRAHYHDGTWSFENPYWRTLKGQVLTTAKPNSLEIHQRIVVGDFFNPPTGEELSVPQLIDSIRASKKAGIDSKELEVKLHEKFSVPIACLVFAFVAPLFALKWARGGAFMGVLLSMGMVVLYYNAFVISTQILAKVDQIPAFVAGWLPDLIFAVAGLIAVRRLE